MPDSHYDVAIVGAGFAGPILAAKIARDGIHPRTRDRLKVALIEAGPYFEGAPRPGYGSPVRRQIFTNLTDGSHLAFLWEGDMSRARLVGGTSAHWDAQAFLPFPVDYVHWEKETGVDWTSENLSAAVAEIRQKFNVHPFPSQVDTEGNRLFSQVARSMGYQPRRGETARTNCLYCGYCSSPIMCKYDSRAGTLVTYIPIAEQHGVEILADTMVEKILIEVRKGRGQATGLACLSQGKASRILADKVVVSGGYLGTPLLLMKSGYGPPEWRGNSIRVENASIGKHIDGHPFTPGVSGFFDDPLGDGEAGSIGGYFMIQDGRSDGEGRLLFRAGFGVRRFPDREALSGFAPEFGRAHKRFMREGGYLRAGSLSPSVGKPSGRWSMEPDGKLLYGGDHGLTIRRAEEGMEMAREVLRKMGARKILPAASRVLIGPGTGGAHKVGSCRAGVDPANSVVNPFFESHDVENLFLCDGSVIPRVTTGNSGTPTAAVAAFAADRMVARHFS